MSEDQLKLGTSRREDIFRVLQKSASILARSEAHVELQDQLCNHGTELAHSQLLSDAAIASSQKGEPGTFVND
jgi:hypothetical protein